MHETKSNFVSFEDIFCDEDNCNPYINNKSLYIYSDHLSFYGSNYLKDFWIEILAKIQSKNN